MASSVPFHKLVHENGAWHIYEGQPVTWDDPRKAAHIIRGNKIAYVLSSPERLPSWLTLI